jgi:hypothetical protein
MVVTSCTGKYTAFGHPSPVAVGAYLTYLWFSAFQMEGVPVEIARLQLIASS